MSLHVACYVTNVLLLVNGSALPQAPICNSLVFPYYFNIFKFSISPSMTTVTISAFPHLMNPGLFPRTLNTFRRLEPARTAYFHRQVVTTIIWKLIKVSLYFYNLGCH